MKTAFILSTGRTGTLFLAEYFNVNYDNVLALHEPKPSYLLRLYSNAYVDGKVSKERMIAILRNKRRKILEHLSTGQYDFYIEANNFIYGFVDVLDRFADEPIILHIIRDPREYVRSAHNHGSQSGKKLLATKLVPYWYPRVRKVLGKRRNTSIARESAKWVLVNNILLERGRQHKHYHFLRFEDIFGATQSGLRQICDIIGLPFPENFTPVPLSTKINPGQQRRLGNWQHWSREQCMELSQTCSPLMQEYGYGLEEEWLNKIG